MRSLRIEKITESCFLSMLQVLELSQVVFALMCFRRRKIEIAAVCTKFIGMKQLLMLTERTPP